MVQHDRLAKRQREVGIPVFHVGVIALAELVVSLAGLCVLVELAWAGAELSGIPRHVARKVTHQVAHGLVGLDLLRYLDERKRPALLASDSTLGFAQLQELTVTHVAADGFGYRSLVSRQNRGGS